MKINNLVKDQYKLNCPISWNKCNDNEQELELKIQRAIDLGKVIYTYGKRKVVRYHHMCFMVDKNEVIAMWRDRKIEEYNVSESEKQNYKPKKLGFLNRLFA